MPFPESSLHAWKEKILQCLSPHSFLPTTAHFLKKKPIFPLLSAFCCYRETSVILKLIIPSFYSTSWIFAAFANSCYFRAKQSSKYQKVCCWSWSVRKTVQQSFEVYWVTHNCISCSWRKELQRVHLSSSPATFEEEKGFYRYFISLEHSGTPCSWFYMLFGNCFFLCSFEALIIIGKCCFNSFSSWAKPKGIKSR